MLSAKLGPFCLGLNVLKQLDDVPAPLVTSYNLSREGT